MPERYRRSTGARIQTAEPEIVTGSADFYSPTLSLAHIILQASVPSTWRYVLYVRKSSEPDDRQVLSIDSQKRELLRMYGHLSIVEVIEEAHSAKAPGRPKFDRMIERLEKGEAHGIIAWHPDRLARNSVDGGRIIYDLDQSKISDLKFAQYTFENSPEGKWMLNIIFGQSKYFVDKLSKDVKRGHRAKLEQGWMPGMAPIGYRNTLEDAKGCRTIAPDPEHFALVRRMWDLMLTGAYSAAQVRNIANERWGFRSRLRPHSGGRPLSNSGIYRILTNPFYYGWFDFHGRLYKGRHEPMITEAEFWQVQKHLGRKGRARPKEKREFAYTGMIRCGECGAGITAEEKWKRNKTNTSVHHYVYYHCTKRKPGVACSQGSIEVGELERQIEAVLAGFDISEEFLDWALKSVRETQEQEGAERRSKLQSLEGAYQSAQKQIDELLNLRLRNLISDREFENKRVELLKERDRLNERRADTEQGADRWFELVERTLRFAHAVRDRFKSGSIEDKRIILETVGSNLLLKDKTLTFEPVEPFCYLRNTSDLSIWRDAVEDVRTFVMHVDERWEVPTFEPILLAA